MVSDMARKHYVVGIRGGGVCVITHPHKPKQEEGYTWATGPFEDIMEAKAYRNAMAGI